MLNHYKLPHFVFTTSKAILSRLTASQPTRSAQAEEWWFDKPREGG